MPARAKSLDPVVYPETDHMGEHELQRFIAELLRPLIERYLKSRGVVAHVGADTFLYFAKGDPTQRIAPDVYVLEGVSQELAVSSWKLWEGTPAPKFALEVVTSDALKDYDDIPAIFGRIGGHELVLFDPEARPTSRKRARFTVFRRGAQGFQLVERTHGDRVRSEALGCWLRAVGEGASRRVRLAIDEHGDVLFPTEAEALEADRAAAETARASAEQARAAAEAENARLRAEIEELRRRRG
ncbi:MAG: Uma2 family endonuclease [Deltaproteobacteria bacterium]|nr:Uma2 family endonuclease [Deltaproteobacteria bacterium]